MRFDISLNESRAIFSLFRASQGTEEPGSRAPGLSSRRVRPIIVRAVVCRTVQQLMSKAHAKTRPATPRRAADERPAPDVVQLRPYAHFWLACLVLAMVTAWVYCPLRDAQFISLDDQQYVTENMHVTTGLTWANVGWAFRDVHLGTWHPVSWLSHLCDVQLYGLDSRGHHLTNLLLHLANEIFLFRVLLRMTGTFWRSLFVAALFGLHPLHVESVAWVSERKDVLSTCFLLLALGAYVAYTRSSVGGPQSEVQNLKSKPEQPQTSAQTPKSSRAWYGLALGLFALGLMSKPMLVTWPVLLLLLDYWPLRRWNAATTSAARAAFSKLLLEKTPFFALALADGVLTFWSQQHAGAMKDFAEVPFGQRAANALVSFALYLGKTAWPANLAVFYPFPPPWPVVIVCGAGVLLLGISVVVLLQGRNRPYLPVGWLWYIIALLPVIGLVQVGGQASADRYTYIPLIGIFLLAAWVAGQYALSCRARVVPVASLCALLLGLCAWTTHRQAGYWRSSQALFTHALETTRGNAVAHHCLGGALWKQGNLDAAAAEFRQALGIRPDHQDARLALALVLGEQGHKAAASVELERLLRRNPRNAAAHFARANLLGQEGRLEQALVEYSQAIQLQPDFAEAHNNLGNALQRLGNLPEAIVHYRAALALAPGFAEAHNNLGRALAAQHQNAQAITQYEAALRAQPGYAEAYNNLANAFAQEGQLDKAVEHYRAALRCQPGYAKAENGLGCALAMQGKSREAAEHFRTAVQLQPDDPRAHFNLGNVLAELEDNQGSRAHFEAALRLDPRLADAHRELGRLFVRLGQEAVATVHLKEAVRLQPDDPEALTALAGLYAAATDARLRDPRQAVQLAQRAVEITGGADAEALSVLASAYNATGAKSEAAATVRRALKAAARAGHTNGIAALQQQLKSYEGN